MKRKFSIGDIVIVKQIGTIPMKVTYLTEDLNEEETLKLYSVILDAIEGKNAITQTNNLSNNENTIYYVKCEWYDSNNNRCSATFNEAELNFYQERESRNIIKGFNR